MSSHATGPIVRTNSGYLKVQRVGAYFAFGFIALAISGGTLQVYGQRVGRLDLTAAVLACIPWLALFLLFKLFKPEAATSICIDEQGIRVTTDAKDHLYPWGDIVQLRELPAETSTAARAGVTRLQIVSFGEMATASGDMDTITPHQFGFATPELIALIKARSPAARVTGPTAHLLNGV